MRKVVVVWAALMCAACGVFDSALESEYKKLAAKPVAVRPASAEEMYNEAEAFAARVEKTPSAPKGLLEKAQALQQKRAQEFGLVSAKNLEIGNLAKVWRAWTGAKLNPDREAKAAGIDVEKLREARKFLESDDPRDWK